MTNLGIISNSAGIDNEMEILTSHSIAEDAIRDLKLYVDYSTKGRIKDIILYRDQPLNVDIDRAHLERLNQPVDLTITFLQTRTKAKDRSPSIGSSPLSPQPLPHVPASSPSAPTTGIAYMTARP